MIGESSHGEADPGMLVGGCDRTAAVPDFATRDSAGVRIVESARPEWEGTSGRQPGSEGPPTP
jgi:hypothetical protein